MKKLLLISMVLLCTGPIEAGAGAGRAKPVDVRQVQRDRINAAIAATKNPTRSFQNIVTIRTALAELYAFLGTGLPGRLSEIARIMQKDASKEIQAAIRAGEKALADYDAYIQDLHRKYDVLEEQAEHRSAEIHAQADSARAELKHMTTQDDLSNLAVLEKKVTTLDIQLAKLQTTAAKSDDSAEIERLTKQLAQGNAQYHVLQIEMKAEIGRLHGLIVTKESQITDLAKAAASSAAEASDIRAALVSAQNALSNEKKQIQQEQDRAAKQQAAIDDLNRKMKELSSTLAQAEASDEKTKLIARLDAQAAHMQEMQRREKENQDKLAALSKQLEGATGTVKKLVDQTAQLEKQLTAAPQAAEYAKIKSDLQQAADNLTKALQEKAEIQSKLQDAQMSNTAQAALLDDALSKTNALAAEQQAKQKNKSSADKAAQAKKAPQRSVKNFFVGYDAITNSAQFAQALTRSYAKKVHYFIQLFIPFAGFPLTRTDGTPVAPLSGEYNESDERLYDDRNTQLMDLADAVFADSSQDVKDALGFIRQVKTGGAPHDKSGYAEKLNALLKALFEEYKKVKAAGYTVYSNDEIHDLLGDMGNLPAKAFERPETKESGTQTDIDMAKFDAMENAAQKTEVTRQQLEAALVKLHDSENKLAAQVKTVRDLAEQAAQKQLMLIAQKDELEAKIQQLNNSSGSQKEVLLKQVDELQSKLLFAMQSAQSEAQSMRENIQKQIQGATTALQAQHVKELTEMRSNLEQEIDRLTADLEKAKQEMLKKASFIIQAAEPAQRLVITKAMDAVTKAAAEAQTEETGLGGQNESKLQAALEDLQKQMQPLQDNLLAKASALQLKDTQIVKLQHEIEGIKASASDNKQLQDALKVAKQEKAAIAQDLSKLGSQVVAYKSRLEAMSAQLSKFESVKEKKKKYKTQLQEAMKTLSVVNGQLAQSSKDSAIGVEFESLQKRFASLVQQNLELESALKTSEAAQKGLATSLAGASAIVSTVTMIKTSEEETVKQNTQLKEALTSQGSSAVALQKQLDEINVSLEQSKKDLTEKEEELAASVQQYEVLESSAYRGFGSVAETFESMVFRVALGKILAGMTLDEGDARPAMLEFRTALYNLLKARGQSIEKYTKNSESLKALYNSFQAAFYIIGGAKTERIIELFEKYSKFMQTEGTPKLGSKIRVFGPSYLTIDELREMLALCINIDISAEKLFNARAAFQDSLPIESLQSK